MMNGYSIDNRMMPEPIFCPVPDTAKKKKKEDVEEGLGLFWFFQPEKMAIQLLC